MATQTTPMPSAGMPDRNATSDHVPDVVQLAQATGTPSPAQPAPIPGVPNGEVHVTMPADQTVVRVQVAPGEIIDLPFDTDLAARFGQQGNLAVKEGDQTIILLGYAEANQQDGVTLHDSHGHNIDVASVVAQTDPNLDIQTAAGPAAGPAAQGGHLFLDFHPGAGLGGFGELNVINPTALQYGLISPDETITRFHDTFNTLTINGLSISSTDGGKTVLLTDVPTTNTPSGSTADGDYLNGGSKEGVAAGSGLVNGHGYHSSDLNLSGTESSSMAVTYESDSAAYHNIVGVYITEPGGTVVVELLWLDNPSGKDFLGNDQPSTVNLNNIPAGSDVQFFLLQNGANNAHDDAILKTAAGGGGNGYESDMSAINSQLTMQQDPATHRWHIYVNGQELNSEMFVTDNSINGNNNQQAIDGTDGGNTLFVGFEDKGLHSGADKDYNDVVLGVQSTSSNPTVNVQTVNPSVLLGDTNSAITEATIDTTGFVVGDSLSNLPSNNSTTPDGFHVSYTQDPSGDYHIDVTQTTNHTTAEWQAFLNSIGFETSSKTDGERDINYGITDAAGNHGTTTSAIDVTHTHSDYLSTETNLNHSGNGLLHDGTTAGHNVNWGAGDDTLFLDQHFTSTDGKLDMGKGDNTLTIEVNNMNITSADASHLANVDHIDMTGRGTNATTLNATDILSMTGDGNTLKIDGDSTDSVKLDGATGGQWSAVSSGVPAGYHEYQWTGGGHTLTVLINDHITQAQIDTTKH
jgi:hypothetical protein